ncbi:MAG: NeuD/PglB/VioB family sugar acetyltransferase [Vicinamibacterales bacterium]|nr:NeuD/PglB/VioB family sugar acetyltransferase [Vicinamibacterales bacterium]
MLGAGGGGRTAVGILERMFAAEGIDLFRERGMAFIDDQKVGGDVNGYPVVAGLADARRWSAGRGAEEAQWLVAFGTTFMRERQQVFAELRGDGVAFVTAVDPSVVRDRTARVGFGTIVAAQCVLNPNSAVGANCFLCVATTVDHDTALGDHVYCSPGVNLAGAVTVEDGAFLGTNAAVLPGVRIGSWATVGAGAVVRDDVPAGCTVVGSPAHIIRKRGRS